VANLLDTQKVWGMTLAAIEPDWVIAELPHLLLRKHDPHWSRAQGQVLASEQISLFGLVLAPKKPVHYGRIAPGEAHDIFVRQALVTGEINTRASFVADNQKVLEIAREEEAKLRRAGIVADEDWQARWYLDRVPPQIHSAAGWIPGGRAGAGTAQDPALVAGRPVAGRGQRTGALSEVPGAGPGAPAAALPLRAGCRR
jgi:ATP-dependent helicase HrpA